MCKSCSKTNISKSKTTVKPPVYRGSQTRVAGTGFGKAAVKITFGGKNR